MLAAVPALDDHVRDTLNRVLDSLRARLESEFGACQEDLVRAANEAGTRIAADSAERAAAEARREAEQQLTEVREGAARDAEEQQAIATAEAAELRRNLDEAREHGQHQIESARHELEAAQHELESTQREMAIARHEIEAVRSEANQLSEEIRRADERFAQAARLPDAIRGLDEATTLGEVLAGLAQSAGREAGRAVVFLVKGERLRDWRTVGFDSESGAPGLDVGLDEAGPMAEVIDSGRGVARWSDTGQPLPSFANENGPRHAVAWPVAVGGSVVAVLYADAPMADNPNEAHWPLMLDVLARHAGRVLEAITVRQAAGLVTSKPFTGGSEPQSAGQQPAGSMQ